MNLTAQERSEYGKTRRDVVSRAAQAELHVKERAFNPIDVLRGAAGGRIRQLLPLKYARMQVSPFAFFRGAVSIMAADLGRLPHSGLNVQLCGDAHVQNLGSFAAPDGKLVFDFNDFDESIRGPWEWDVKRMAASMVLAGDASGHDRPRSRGAAEVFSETYCDSIREFANLPILQIARRQIHREQRIEPVHAALLQSQRVHPADLLMKLTETNRRGRFCFRNLQPLSWRITGARAQQVLHSLHAYRDCLGPERRHLFDLFHPVDVGFKVVGTGSVGLRDYIVLFEGNGRKDPMFLQIKQEMPSAYAKWLPEGGNPHAGRRAAEGQRAIQPISDLLLGWTTIGEHQYLVRQLNDHKGSIDLQNLRRGGLESLAQVAGELLARGHARSGDARAIQGYCGSGGKVVRALRDFACAYADQTNLDFSAFTAAIKGGKIKVARTEEIKTA
jgi:uncharacterized protein (DUF2252 family)